MAVLHQRVRLPRKGRMSHNGFKSGYAIRGLARDRNVYP